MIWVDCPAIPSIELGRRKNQVLSAWTFTVLLSISLTPVAVARYHFRVTSVLIEPYLMIDQANANHTGNDRYTGYVADLMQELSQRVGFHYRIHVVRDGKYGIRRPDGSWDGMIGELQRNEADIATAPLYITDQRKSAVIFSEPFMRVQATILLSKYENYPGIKTARDLLNQENVQYGTLNTGVIVHAFKHTNDTGYRAMWQVIKDSKSHMFTASNEEGIERVRAGGYAFILPSTIGDYISMQTHCDLKTFDRFLMKRDFALAVSKRSQRMSLMLPDINLGMERLRDAGRLDAIYKKWWLDKDHCGTSKSSSVVSHGHFTSRATTATVAWNQSTMWSAYFSLIFALHSTLVDLR